MSREEAIELKIKFSKMFCQHCKAIQKVMEIEAECWYNPLTEEGELTFCASNQDAIEHYFNLIHDAGYRLIPELKPLSDEEIQKLLGVDFKTEYSGHVEEYRAISQRTIASVLEQIEGEK